MKINTRKPVLGNNDYIFNYKQAFIINKNLFQFSNRKKMIYIFISQNNHAFKIIPQPSNTSCFGKTWELNTWSAFHPCSTQYTG